MRRELAAILGSDNRAADVIVGGASWRVHIFGIAVIGGDAFVQVAIVGPVTSTATVRIAARVVEGVTGRQILDTICDWLESGDHRHHGYLDARGADARPPEATDGCAVRATAI
jgi:hypothetical protein